MGVSSSRRDAEHYNYFRDYDPAIGRYIESDPLGLKAGSNTYAYVKGRPLNLRDPRGLLVPQGCSPEQGKAIADAEAQIQKKLDSSCMACGGPKGCIPCDLWEGIRKALQTSVVKCDAQESPNCGDAAIGGSDIRLFRGYGSPRCGPLASLLLHELAHNAGLGDAYHLGVINDLEKECFNFSRY